MTEVETCCDECGSELEVGQTGSCDDCREYTFGELNESAKNKARDAMRYTEHYLDYEWWDGVYENADQIAKILGLDIEETKTRAGNKGTYNEINISFSGFCSQGDGACFHGRYSFNPKGVEEIKAHCNDEELYRIATELHAMQITQRLLGNEYFSAKITTSGRYSHSHTMSVEIPDWGCDEVGEPDEDQFTQFMRDFADWIYSALESENDHLMSDEVVDMQLEDEKFDVSGSTI